MAHLGIMRDVSDGAVILISQYWHEHGRRPWLNDKNKRYMVFYIEFVDDSVMEGFLFSELFNQGWDFVNNGFLEEVIVIK